MVALAVLVMTSLPNMLETWGSVGNPESAFAVNLPLMNFVVIIFLYGWAYVVGLNLSTLTSTACAVDLNSKLERWRGAVLSMLSPLFRLLKMPHPEKMTPFQRKDWLFKGFITICDR
jgi:hypothetical protein